MKEFEDLNGKRVFITGAASGIGYELALAFAREGADVIATDLNEQGLVQLAGAVEAMGRRCRTFKLDVCDDVAFDALATSLHVENVLPDIVINNAGIGYLMSFADSTIDVWRRTLDINVIGVANGCRAFLPRLQAAGRPALFVNVASMASLAPMANMAAYAASKYAVEGLSEVLALELDGSPVGVMTVHPGVINTPIVSNPAMTRVPAEQLERLQRYYREKGALPSAVAADVVSGVKRGASAVFTGPGATLGSIAKRWLSRRWFRRILLKSARDIGYL